MPEPIIQPTESHENTTVQPTSKDPTTAGNIATSNNTKENYTAATKINSISDFKDVAPKLYNAMMMGIAQHICSEMREHIERFRKLMREGRQG